MSGDILTNKIELESTRLGIGSEIIKLWNIIKNDQSDGTDERAVYLFANTSDNEEMVTSFAKDLRRANQVDNVLISDAKTCAGYPGFKRWEFLLKSEFNEGAIVKVPFLTNDHINTLSESESLVEFISKNPHFTSLCMAAAPFHQLRAFMTLVSVSLRNDLQLNLVNRTGAEQNWNQKVYHSQGVLYDSRINMVSHELERIKRYQNKGDILPTKLIIDYALSRQKGGASE